MALNEIQQFKDKDAFYHILRVIATEAIRNKHRWGDLYERLALMGPADLTDLTVPAGLHDEIADFRTSLNNIVSAINAEETTLDKFRNALIV